MKKQLFVLLLFALAAYGQQERIAILNTVDDSDSVKLSDLSYLTTRFRELAAEVLPKSRYAIMSVQSIIDFLGSEERAIKECKAASCLAALGRKVSADYVAQARLGKFDKDLTIGVELYSSKSGVMVGSFTGKSKNISGLLAVLNEKAPLMFEKILSDSESSVKIYENKETPKIQSSVEKDYENVEYTHEGTDKPSISVDSSMSVEFSKPNRLKFGIGGAFDQLSFRDNVNFGNSNIEATRLIGDAFSLGVVMSIPFVNLLTFNPEFYLVYRTIKNDYECSTICQIIIKEFAINIPLIVSLEFAGETDNNIRVGGYIEAGASLDIPLSTSVNSNPEIYVDREKFNSSVVFGAGFILGDFYLGARGNIGITFFDKNAGGKFSSRIFIARYFF